MDTAVNMLGEGVAPPADRGRQEHGNKVKESGMLLACLRIAVGQLKHMLARVDFWIVVVVLAVLFSACLQDVRVELSATGMNVGVFSAFSIVARNGDMLLMTLLAYLLLSSDMPDFRNGMDQQILRVRRGVWYASQWLYMLLLTAGYFLLANLAGVLFLLPGVSMTGLGAGEWAMRFVLVVLLALFLSGICCVCNLMNLHKGVGVLIDALFIFLWLRYDRGAAAFGLVSPVEAFARFGGADVREFGGYAAYYVILCVAVFAIGFWRLSRADIRTES